VVDAIGRAVGLSLAPGQQYDVHACEPLAPPSGRANGCSPTKDSIRAVSIGLGRTGAMVCIPPLGTRRIQYSTADVFIDIAIPSRTSSAASNVTAASLRDTRSWPSPSRFRISRGNNRLDHSRGLKTLPSSGNSWPLGFDAFAPLITDLNCPTFVTVNYGSGTPRRRRPGSPTPTRMRRCRARVRT